MTEDYISGYLECVSRVKDIVTPHVGGFNQFFSIDRNSNRDVLADIKSFMTKHKDYYQNSFDDRFFENTLNKISILKIDDWKKNLQQLIQNWTCDIELTGIHGKNGYLLSEYLVNSLLKDFFKDKDIEVFKLLPDWGTWHWGDHMSEEYLFVTGEKIFIMHLGESS
ncbi:MAG: hypothetical protein IM627_08675 [Cytophagales bacterium]|jgi:hypothetical protein|nr:hypothetical protein [Cytophagales bacterium]